MNASVLKKWVVMASGAATMMAASPVFAQQAPGTDIDALIDASSTPDTAVAMARSQAGDGDLTGAAATLERALLNARADRVVSVRLYYITILCRLDDHERANVELAKLGGRKIDGAGWSEAQTACGAIQLPENAPRADTGVVGEIAAGVAYDSDSSGALATEFDFGFPVVHDDAGSFIASANLDGRAAFGGGFLYGGLNALAKDSFSGPSLNYQLATLRAGYGLRVGIVELSAGPVGRYARIAGQSFFSEYGGQAEIALPGENSRASLRGEMVHQDYTGSLPFFSRDGTRYDLALDYQGRPIDRLTWEVGAAFEHKTAETSDLGYTGGRIYGAAKLPIDAHGTYAGFSGTVRHIAYRGGFFVNRQIETRYFARAAIGTPICENLDLEAAASYTRRDYNRASFLLDYDNVGGEIRLVWHFGG